jgi:AcrR family transcriptional regulator
MGRNSNDNERQRAHTRALLVQTALELFAEHGVTGTTMASLARAAGVSKGLTYHYFPSKDALVAAVVAQRRDALRALGDAIPVDLPPAQKLRAFARASVEQVANDPGGFRLYLRFLAAPDGQASVGAAGLDRSELIGLFVAMGSLEPAR